MFIDGFGLSNYRSFGEELQFIGPCTKVNILIGQNNSGKSNILRYIKEQMESAIESARTGQEQFSLSELDRHVGVNSGNLQFALGVERTGELPERILLEAGLEDGKSVALLHHILQFPEFSLGPELSWFIYETGGGPACKVPDSSGTSSRRIVIIRRC